MPCHTDPPSSTEYAQRNEVTEQLDSLNERATHGADLLREYILGNVAVQRIMPLLNMRLAEEFDKLEDISRTHWLKADSAYVKQVHELVTEYEEMNELVATIGKDTLSAADKAVIEARQKQHRSDDLRRLMKTFADSGDKDKLLAVINATPDKPLAVQLGFDPDDF